MLHHGLRNTRLATIAAFCVVLMGCSRSFLFVDSWYPDPPSDTDDFVYHCRITIFDRQWNDVLDGDRREVKISVDDNFGNRFLNESTRIALRRPGASCYWLSERRVSIRICDAPATGATTTSKLVEERVYELNSTSSLFVMRSRSSQDAAHGRLCGTQSEGP